MDRRRLEEVLRALGDRLEGEWMLLGGAAVALWIEPRRTTEDIDIVGFGGTAQERRSLMELAVELGLPIEALNSAADFFLFRIPDWRAHAEPLFRGARSIVHRPSPTLFLLLKMGRLTSEDLSDCLALLAKVRREGLLLDAERVLAALGSLPSSQDPGLLDRRARLRDELEGLKPPALPR